MAVDSKLRHLILYGDQVSSVNLCKTLPAYDFVKRMEEARSVKDEAIARDVQSVHLVSYTTSSRYPYTVETIRTHRGGLRHRLSRPWPRALRFKGPRARRARNYILRCQ
jgi:hypothetical protein